eukprot:TRINITY_DN6142_c0_g1_i1.p1 TRINITY_DN6142_c0_g1~~TRINITY_DN6142_c0_g1_i1.p1  ORF type:complete len:243 (-),score=86.88 TRINITY_DN6142_c0_g1_i1:63-725(-)
MGQMGQPNQMGGMGQMNQMGGMRQADSQQQQQQQQQQFPCGYCKQFIDTRFAYLKVFNMFWHPNHICCKSCQKDFTDASRKAKEGSDGFVYCSSCFADKFAPKCAVCQNAILGEFVSATDKFFHKECFACDKCKQPFTKSFYPNEQGKLLCERHFFEAKGLLCGGCDQPIVSGKAVAVGAKKYHPDHFECSRCKVKLAGQAYKAKDNKPFCPSCFIQYYG